MNNLRGSVAVKYGLILGGISLVTAVIIMLTVSLESRTASGVAQIGVVAVGWISAIVCIVMAHYEFNKKNGNYLSFADAIVIGLIVLGISACISVMMSYLSFEFVIKEKYPDLPFMTLGAIFANSAANFLLHVIVLFLIIMLEAQWKIYKKAGKEGWASLVPFYNIIVLLEIVKKPAGWLVWLLIPFVNIIFSIMVVNALSKKFGKDESFTFGLIFLPFVFYPMLGLSRTEYSKEQEPLWHIN